MRLQAYETSNVLTHSAVLGFSDPDQGGHQTRGSSSMHLRPKVIEGRMSTELRRQLREEAHPICAISGATPHHAQLAEAAGFRLFFHSGSQSAATILGLP